MRRIPIPPDSTTIWQEWGTPQNEPYLGPATAFARKIAPQYYHWDKLSRIARAEGVNPRLAWAITRLARDFGSKQLPLYGVWGHYLWYSLTDRLQSELMQIDQELAHGLKVDLRRGGSKGAPSELVVSSVMDEAIWSSRIEGASTLHRVAKQMLREDRPPRNEHEQMIRNNYRAMQIVRERRDEKLTTEFLLELQSTLTEKTLKKPDQQGRLRRQDEKVDVVDNHDGEIVHTPPPASELRDRIGMLCDFANRKEGEGAEFIHPIIKAITLHFQIGHDHPFCDGNGRTARALFYWSVLRDGYTLFEFLPISRLIVQAPNSYVRAYMRTETDMYDLTYFLHFNIAIVSRARAELRETLATKRREMESIDGLLAQFPGLNERQRSILVAVVNDPLRRLTIEAHKRSNDISYFTARADLIGLAEAGLLTSRRQGKKLVFRASPAAKREA